MDCGVGMEISTKQSQDLKRCKIQKNREDEEEKEKKKKRERTNDYIEEGKKKKKKDKVKTVWQRLLFP